jgi:polyisoprenoid-binding protein YceI
MYTALLLWVSRALAGDLHFAPQSVVTFHNGSTLGDFSGTAPIAGFVDPVARRGALDIATASMSTGSGPRDARMLAYCLEAPRFPTIHFSLTTITGDVAALKAGGPAGTVTLVGALTIRDVTRTVSVPASFSYDATGLKLSGRYDLKWGDFGVPDPSVVIATLAPDMYVSFDIVAAASAAGSTPAVAP